MHPWILFSGQWKLVILIGNSWLVSAEFICSALSCLRQTEKQTTRAKGEHPPSTGCWIARSPPCRSGQAPCPSTHPAFQCPGWLWGPLGTGDTGIQQGEAARRSFSFAIQVSLITNQDLLIRRSKVWWINQCEALTPPWTESGTVSSVRGWYGTGSRAPTPGCWGPSTETPWELLRGSGYRGVTATPRQQDRSRCRPSSPTALFPPPSHVSHAQQESFGHQSWAQPDFIAVVNLSES